MDNKELMHNAAIITAGIIAQDRGMADSAGLLCSPRDAAELYHQVVEAIKTEFGACAEIGSDYDM